MALNTIGAIAATTVAMPIMPAKSINHIMKDYFLCTLLIIYTKSTQVLRLMRM